MVLMGTKSRWKGLMARLNMAQVPHQYKEVTTKQAMEEMKRKKLKEDQGKLPKASQHHQQVQAAKEAHQHQLEPPGPQGEDTQEWWSLLYGRGRANPECRLCPGAQSKQSEECQPSPNQ